VVNVDVVEQAHRQVLQRIDVDPTTTTVSEAFVEATDQQVGSPFDCVVLQVDNSLPEQTTRASPPSQFLGEDTGRFTAALSPVELHRKVPGAGWRGACCPWLCSGEQQQVKSRQVAHQQRDILHPLAGVCERTTPPSANGAQLASGDKQDQFLFALDVLQRWFCSVRGRSVTSQVLTLPLHHLAAHRAGATCTAPRGARLAAATGWRRRRSPSRPSGG
jgi:hypothetical protein